MIINCSLDAYLPKVRSFLEHSCAILSSFKIVVIFNTTSTGFVLIILKMTTILKELRIAQLCPKNGRTLVCLKFFACSRLISYRGNIL